MSQPESDISWAKLEIVPDAKSGDYLLLANGKPLSHLDVDFRHKRKELLENIASELRATGRFESPDLSQLSYSNLFLSGNKNPEWDWKTKLYKDPVLLTDSFHATGRVERMNQGLALLRYRWGELSSALRQQVEALDRQASRWGRKLKGEYEVWPKDFSRLKPIKEFFEKHGLDHPEIYLHDFRCEYEIDATNVNKAVKRRTVRKSLQRYADDQCGFLFDDGTDVFVSALPEYSDAMINLIKQVEKEWRQLSREQKGVVEILFSIHSSVVLALLIAMGECSASEYAASVLWGVEGEEPLRHLNFDESDATQTAVDDDYEDLRELLEFWTEHHGDAHDDHNQARYKQILADANIAVDYLKLCENPVMEIIRCGEGKHVEFKASFRWDIKEDKIIDGRKTDVLKGIVAFLNSGGGTLLLGVGDDRSILGIERDGYKSQDEYRRALVSSITNRIGREFLDAVQINFCLVGPHQVISVTCLPGVALEPAFLDNTELYVREDASTKCLTGRDLMKWLRAH